jgi:hypothetical protein
MKTKKNFPFLMIFILSILIGILLSLLKNNFGLGIMFIITGVSFMALFSNSSKEKPTAEITKLQLWIIVVLITFILLILSFEYFRLYMP